MADLVLETSNRISTAKEDLFQLYPNTLLEQNPMSTSFANETPLILGMDGTLDLQAKVYSSNPYTPFAAQGDVHQGTLDHSSFSYNSLYSFPLASPAESDYESMANNNSWCSEEDRLGTQNSSADFSPEMLFPKDLLYESSISPSSSRPCTASYETALKSNLDGMSLPPEISHQPANIPFDCPMTCNEGFLIQPPLAQCTTASAAPPESIEATPDSWSLLCLTPHVAPPQPELIGLGTWPSETLDSEKLNFGVTPIVNPVYGNVNANEQENLSSFPWSSAWARGQRPRTDGPFPHNEVFTSRCVQPHRLIGQVLDGACGSYGTKASFLPGNWECQHGGDEVKNGDLLKAKSSTSGRGHFGKKVTKRRSGFLPGLSASLKESVPSSTHQNMTISAPESSVTQSEGDSSNAPNTSSPQLLEAIVNKTADGKYICPHLGDGSSSPCGKPFQRAEHLKRHWLTHFGVRPFPCEICHRCFGRTDNLKQHTKTHANLNGRNSKLLRAKQQQKSNDGNKGGAHDRRPCKRRRVSKV